MRTFVMGDIHGTYKALKQCLERSGFDYARDRLIQLGDITDGYEEVYACVEELLKINHLVAIRGNHDDWFNTFIQSGYHPEYWFQGGLATARSYMRALHRRKLIKRLGSTFSITLTPDDIPAAHRQFFHNQRLYYIDDQNNCFVHAGFDRYAAFEGQIPELYYWDRELWATALLYQAIDKIEPGVARFDMVTTFNEIFIGHTSTTNWDTDKPMTAANIHNVDTGAGHTGRLTIMDIQSKEFWQSDPVRQLYKPRKR